MPQTDQSPSNAQAVEAPLVGSESRNDDVTESIVFTSPLQADIAVSEKFDFGRFDTTAFGKLLEAVSVPTLLVARTHSVRFVNTAFTQLTRGDAPTTDIALSLVFSNPREARHTKQWVERVFTDRKPLVKELVLHIQDSAIWGRMHLRSVRIGREPFVLVQIENLTAHKQLFDAQKYKKLVDLFPVGIAEFALPKPQPCSLPVARLLEAILDARAVDGNKEFAALYKRKSIGEVMGLPFKGFLPSSGKMRAVYDQWIKAGFPIRSFETKETVRSAVVRYFDDTLMGNVNAECVYGFWWIRRDISERKRMEQEMLKTQKLESLGILAGGIAHDFNNLLTGILGNISLAQTYLSGGDEASEKLDAACKAATRAQDLTRQLLTFSRGGAPVKRTGSIAELLRDSVLFAVRGSNVRCDVSIPDDLWPIDMDEGQINRVINNLVINAVQAMPNGGTLYVQASNLMLENAQAFLAKAGPFVRIAIRDTGVGIPAHVIQKIFDPYFTTKQKGTGLGLAISYAVVRKHDGFMTVKSRAGKGSTFYIYLPASAKRFQVERRIDAAIERGTGRVLVMDDEEMIRELAGELLRGLGYAVSFARDGTEAIAVYEQALKSGVPFDAVIMDLTIPGGLGGRETIRQLRSVDPQIKAIVSSGYSNDPIMADYQRHGFSGVLPKPYQLSELSHTLKQVTAGKRKKSR